MWVQKDQVVTLVSYEIQSKVGLSTKDASTLRQSEAIFDGLEIVTVYF